MSNLLDALWVEYLDRDADSNEAEGKLLTAARTERRLASEWATDHALDCSLRSFNQLVESEDAFVAEWEQRLQESLGGEPPVGQVHVAERPVVKPSLQTSRGALPAKTQRHGARPSSQTQATAALIATVALIALVAISFWIFRGDRGLAKQEAPKPKPKMQPSKNLPKTRALVEEPGPKFFPKIQPPEFKSEEPPHIIPVVWKEGGPHDNRLPPGEHRLASGLVELIGGRATPVKISGPATVKVGDDYAWLVQQGTVSVKDISSGERLPIVTPNSRIKSQGAEFVVSVNAAGQTDLQVNAGEVHLLSDAAGENAAPLKLLAGQFERALLSPAGKEPGERAAFCELQGPADRFCGLIQLDGKTLRFTSPAEFQEFQQQVEQQFAKDAEALRQQWPDLVKALGGLGGGEIQLQRDGEAIEVQTLQQLLELIKKMPMPMPPAGFPKPGELKPGIPKSLIPKPGDLKGGSNTSFQGSIIINGQEQKFNSAEEFNAARQKMLKDLPGIDLPGFDLPEPFKLP